MLEIRQMTQEDIDKVYRIEVLSFRTPWSKHSLASELNNRLAHYLVLYQDETLLGYCGMWVIFDECHITNIAIDPAYRGKGYGKSLLLAAMEVGQHFGATMMTLEVRETNRIAQDLYAQFDFERKGFRKRYYEDTGEGAFLLWNTNMDHTIQSHTILKQQFNLQINTFEKKAR